MDNLSKSALIVTCKRLLDNIDQDDRLLEIPATNGHVLEQVFCATVFGLDIDVQLSFTCHVDKVCKKLSKRIGILTKIKTCLPLKQQIIFYNAMIKPVITYAMVVRLTAAAKKICIKLDTITEMVNILNAEPRSPSI